MIRSFDDKDLPQVADLFVRVFNLPPWNEDWSYEKAYNHIETISNAPDFIGFVAVNEDLLLAVLLGRLQDNLPNRIFRIGEIFVEPDYHRQGIGTALLCHLNQQMCELSVHRITATTLAESPAAYFYMRQGFSDTGPVSYSVRKHIFEKKVGPNDISQISSV
jgi:ribosomal protein S18 acetylase RimI-like enzyme